MGVNASVMQRCRRVLLSARRGAGVCVCLLAVSAASARGADGPGAGITRTPRDVVLLIDISGSMDEIFPTVQGALREFIDGSARGDSITLVPFADRARTLESVVLRGDGDRARLKAEIGALEPSGYYTDITGALQHGTRILRTAHEQPGGARRLQLVLLLTDGRHNPPDRAAAPTFDDIVSRYSDFRPGQEWFVHYITVGDVLDEETLGFITAAAGRVTRLEKADIGSLESVLRSMDMPVVVSVEDLIGEVTVRGGGGGGRPAVLGARLTAGQTLVTGADGRAVVRFEEIGSVGVDPDTVMEIRHASRNPAIQTQHVVLWVPAGRVWAQVSRRRGNLAFEIHSPQAHSRVTGTAYVQEVSAASGLTRIAVFGGTVVASDPLGEHAQPVLGGRMILADTSGTLGAPVPWPQPLSETQRVWRQALDEGKQLRELLASFAAVRWQVLEVEFGPVQAGAQYREALSVDLGVLTSPRLTADIVHATWPPDLFDVQATVHPPAAGVEGPTRVEVSARVADAWTAQRTERYEGLVELRGPDLPPGLKMRFPVYLFREPTPSRAATTASTPGVLWWLLGVSLLLPAVGYVVMRWRASRGFAVPLGRLLLRKNPAPRAWSTTSIDLEGLCKRQEVTEVSIGAGPTNLIQLPDPLLREEHAVLRVRGRHRANRRVYLYLARGAHVRVNNVIVRRGPIEMLDGMLIRFGNFIFEYEDSRNSDQIEIAMRDRRIVHGVLRSWDLTASTFMVSQEERDLETTESPERMIAFADVEDISVLRREDAKRTLEPLRQRAHGAKARVHMRSGRRHEGWVRHDYNHRNKRFYFFPAHRPDVDYMIIEAESVKRLQLDSE